MEKRKTQLYKAIIIALAFPLSSCRSADNAMEISKQDNYYSGIYVDKINDMEYISHLECTDNMTYAVGPLSNLVCDKVIDIYDSAGGESRSIDLKIDDCYSIDALYADDSVIYVGYRDSGSNSRAGTFSRLTGEKLSDIMLSDEYYVYSVFKDSFGKVYFHMVSTSGFKLDSFIKVYDQSLTSQSEINICEKMNLSGSEKPVRIISDTKGGYYVFTLDVSNSFAPAVYRVSEKFEVKYSVDDFSDMSGDPENICINPEGNLLVIFKDADTDTYFINEINSENGKVSERYEREFDDNAYLTGNLFNSVGQTSEKYDFYISKKDGIYGYDLKTDNSEKVFINSSEKSPDCIFIENDNMLIYNSQAGNDDFAVCRIDESGNVSEHLIFEKDEGYLGDVFIDEKENLYFAEIIDDTQIAVCDEGNALFMISTDENIDSFYGLYADADGDFHMGYVTCESDTDALYLNYLVCDKEGKELFKKKHGINSYVFGVLPSCKDNSFRMIYTDTENRFVINSIDYKTGNESEIKHNIIPDNIEELYKGDETFDFYYSAGNAIYGYLEQEKKSEEIIDFNNSQLYANPEIVCLKNDGSLVCAASDESSPVQKICFLNKADKETVEKLKNRTVINLTAFDITENLRKAVNQYNNLNNEYLIHLTYGNTISEFDKSIVSDKAPDIVLWDEKTDMSSYLRNGFFTDLNTYLEKDEKISSSDLLQNIYNMCSRSGKTEYLLLDFMAEALICDRSEWEKDFLTYDALFSFDKENIFYDMTGEELLELLVTDNISDFVDLDKKECYFDSDKFADILKFIKRAAVLEKNQIVTFDDYEEANRRFDEDRCFLEKVTLSKSQICSLRNSVVSDISLFGFPSYDKMYSHIVANNLIGISEKSENKDAAWDFVSFLLQTSYQDGVPSENNGLFPVNKESFEKARKSMYDDKNNDIINMIFDYAENECSSFMCDEHMKRIIKEQSDMFFSDIQSVDDTIANIDKKIKIYLSEIYS